MGNRISSTGNIAYGPVSSGHDVQVQNKQQKKQKLDEGHIFYRKQMSIFLIILSICLVSFKNLILGRLFRKNNNKLPINIKYIFDSKA